MKRCPQGLIVLVGGSALSLELENDGANFAYPLCPVVKIRNNGIEKLVLFNKSTVINFVASKL